MSISPRLVRRMSKADGAAVWIEGGKPMRVMVLVKATKDSEAGVRPSTNLLAAMGQYNEDLVKAGIMLAGEGLHPSSKGKRVAFDGPSRTVIDGPFPETRELVAGFWLWQGKDMGEAGGGGAAAPIPCPGRGGSRAPPRLRPPASARRWPRRPAEKNA